MSLNVLNIRDVMMDLLQQSPGLQRPIKMEKTATINEHQDKADFIPGILVLFSSRRIHPRDTLTHK